MCGIKQYLDSSFTHEPGIYELDKRGCLRVYNLRTVERGKRVYVSFKKPRQKKCKSIVCFDKIPYGIPAFKCVNWDELPEELPFNQEILDSYFFDGYKIIIQQ